MRNKLAALLASILVATGLLLAGGTTPASADAGYGEYHKCWDPYNGWVSVPATYDRCFYATLEIFSTYSGKKVLQLDGTCSAMLRRNGFAISTIRYRCQDWPSNNYPGGDYWTRWV